MVDSFDNDTEFEALQREEEFLKNLKATIEGRLPNDSLSIKDIILGRATQRVEIIPDELDVIYRSPKAGELTRVRHMSMERNPDTGKTEVNTQKHSFLHLSIYISKLNDTDMLPTFVNGKFSEENVEKNAEMLKELDDNLIIYLLWNRGWFLERVRAKMTSAMLGNG